MSEPTPEQVEDEEVRQFFAAARVKETRDRWAWASLINQLGSYFCGVWVLIVAFKTDGVLAGLVALILVGIVVKIGTPLLFMAASSALCFYFGSVGIWLPLLSYFVSAICFYAGFQINRAAKLRLGDLRGVSVPLDVK